MAQRPSPTLANAVAPGVRVERIEPLQRRVEKNRLRFVGFMVAFTTCAALALFACLLLAVWVAVLLGLGPRLGSPGAVVGWTLGVSLAVVWAWALAIFFRADITLLARLGARMPKAGTLMPTKSVLRDMAIAAGLPRTPYFYVIDTPGVNAFVLGRSIERVRIGVTRGMLERVPAGEQRAVFANLIARVLTRDTLWATAVSALMGPIWAMRDFDLRYDPTDPSADARLGGRPGKSTDDQRAGAFLVYGLAVVVTELLSWYHQEAAWKAAEKADAEGMLLLKDPQSMLRAIEHVLERNNHVPAAGDAYSQLFFCWAGFGFAPEDDPEMRRVARLRETLGAEGAAYVPRPNFAGWPTAPRAPRLELAEEIAQRGGADAP